MSHTNKTEISNTSSRNNSHTKGTSNRDKRRESSHTVHNCIVIRSNHIMFQI